MIWQLLMKIRENLEYLCIMIASIIIFIPVLIIGGGYILYLRIFNKKVYDAMINEENDLFDTW